MMKCNDRIKANTYTEHEMVVPDGMVVEPQVGAVVTKISTCAKGGCIVYYHLYKNCPIEQMLSDGGIALAKE